MFSLDPAEVLLTMGEVSVAFAGFASLIAVLGLRSSESSRPFDLLRYWVMLEFSIAALGFSLLPLVLGFLGVAEVVIWRGSSALMALFVVTHNVVLARRYVRGDEIFPRRQGRANLIAANLTYVVIALTQIGNAVGLFDRAFGWYLVGLFLVLFVASAHFILFIAHALESLRRS